jgi:hypothetical protein
VFLLFSYIIINGFFMSYVRNVAALETIKDGKELARGAWGYGRHEVGSIARVKGLSSKLVGLA